MSNMTKPVIGHTQTAHFKSKDISSLVNTEKFWIPDQIAHVWFIKDNFIMVQLYVCCSSFIFMECWRRTGFKSLYKSINLTLFGAREQCLS